MIGKKVSNYLKKSIISLISAMTVFSLASNTTINAKHRTHIKHKRTHKVTHKYHRKRNYLIGNSRHPIYILNWSDIKNLRVYRGTFRAKDDTYSLPVRVVSKVKVGNNTFDKVRFSSYFKNWMAGYILSPYHIILDVECTLSLIV